MVTSTKFDVEKFDGTNNFGMWQCEAQDVLFQQELDVALEESRPEDVDEKDWTKINRLKGKERVYLKHVWLKMISQIFHWLVCHQ